MKAPNKLHNFLLNLNEIRRIKSIFVDTPTEMGGCSTSFYIRFQGVDVLRLHAEMCNDSGTSIRITASRSHFQHHTLGLKTQIKILELLAGLPKSFTVAHSTLVEISLDLKPKFKVTVQRSNA